MTTIESYGVIPLKKVDGTWHVLIILHRQGSHWAFPKGRADEGEMPLDAARRELKEETGLNIVTLLTEDPLIEYYHFYKGRERILKVVNYFPALVDGELVLQEEEVRDAKWVALNEAISHLTFREAQEICRKVLELMAKK